jgi:hypothetical protein
MVEFDETPAFQEGTKVDMELVQRLIKINGGYKVIDNSIGMIR